MVKLTKKYLFRKICKKNQLQPKKADERDIEYLNRLTHLHLQSQFIDKITSVPRSLSVSVIYLQNNLLQSIHNLDKFPNLTHLHLEHNFISKIENLSALKNLKKLYLGHNEISVVEGLEELENLKELHLESQRLPQGETLYFDPRTLFQLKNSLEVLNISNNNVSSLSCIADLTSLTKLIVEDNQLSDIDDIMETLSCLPVLETLCSTGNPVTGDRKYFDAVVMASKSLKMLDDKAIEERTRVFITNLSHNKEFRRKLSEFSTRAFNSEHILPRSSLASASPLQCASSLGSKLFPVMKRFSDTHPIAAKTLSKNSTKSLSPVFDSSIRVTGIRPPVYYY